ncbi:uncharacterized protein LOC143491197 [Brachyhypopomus gauderio]|uniref:uncharacterized protein LOC143491197 n=1 Tax=Brachyhypopomus gauderio TaxID=698409 RepID=UPI004041AFF7
MKQEESFHLRSNKLISSQKLRMSEATKKENKGVTFAAWSSETKQRYLISVAPNVFSSIIGLCNINFSHFIPVSRNHQYSPSTRQLNQYGSRNHQYSPSTRQLNQYGSRNHQYSPSTRQLHQYGSRKPLQDQPRKHLNFRGSEMPQFVNKIVQVLELGLIGGADIKDTVWRILKQAIKNNLAKTVNWRGVNGKTGFQSLELKSVVIEAVRRNPLCANATDIEVEKVIKRWFHLAGDREGGRKRRKQIAEDMESNKSGKNM